MISLAAIALLFRERVIMRVGCIVCKVGALSEHAKVSEADVKPLLALVDNFRIRSILARTMEQKLNELRRLLVRIFLDIDPKLVEESLLYCLVL